jgi:hypothetical protein
MNFNNFEIRRFTETPGILPLVTRPHFVTSGQGETRAAWLLTASWLLRCVIHQSPYRNEDWLLQSSGDINTSRDGRISWLIQALRGNDREAAGMHAFYVRSSNVSTWEVTLTKPLCSDATLKLSLCTSWRHARRVELYLHSFLISVPAVSLVSWSL